VILLFSIVKKPLQTSNNSLTSLWYPEGSSRYTHPLSLEITSTTFLQSMFTSHLYVAVTNSGQYIVDAEGCSAFYRYFNNIAVGELKTTNTGIKIEETLDGIAYPSLKAPPVALNMIPPYTPGYSFGIKYINSQACFGIGSLNNLYDQDACVARIVTSLKDLSGQPASGFWVWNAGFYTPSWFWIGPYRADLVPRLQNNNATGTYSSYTMAVVPYTGVLQSFPNPGTTP